ncbi:MAG: alpha-glucosidase C-terminal domain-containing protein [Ignavibacteriae bacterium]|nr:alpha-glucosidase C-terminal domain-containing protein [Ignavibacteriota bacterium]
MKRYTSPQALDLLEEAIRKRQKETRKRKFSYYVPSLWISKTPPKKIKVEPFSFYLKAIRRIKRSKPPREAKPTGGEWSKEAVIYNMFVRTTTAFDHDANGKLDLPVNSQGFRETGTFLKSIVLLPYIKRLGANTVHLLPVTAIGHDGNKGSLGSPYAIRNPYELDENLGEPCVGLDVKTEFKAFVEAAHRLGLRVVVEFVFRTAAKDSDWVKDHPEWMYWIKDNVPLRAPGEFDEMKYGSPIFNREELDRIHHQVRDHQFDNLLAPHETYRRFFTQPPPSDFVAKENGRYIGVLPDGTRAKIPGAFADWPPDDNQPPWGDVTYLRMYDHSDFNYIAYNTIRMYDDRLARAENINRPLWRRIIGIIPFYQREFLIDGVMIDMGHALPRELKSEMVKTARDIDPDFAFWDENFSITQRSREEGYNAVFGFFWIDQHHPGRMKAFCRRTSTDGFPIPFFATPENHNTPRAASRPGGLSYAMWTIVINSFLPGIPFIHSGFEIAESYPINTGLDFTNEQLKRFPSEKLPLFSEYAYDWMNKEQFVKSVSKVLSIRNRFRSIVTDPRPQSFMTLNASNDHILAFARISEALKKRVAVVGNMNYAERENSSVAITTARKHVVDLLTGKKIGVRDRHVDVTLPPGGCFVFEF